LPQAFERIALVLFGIRKQVDQLRLEIKNKARQHVKAFLAVGGSLHNDGQSVDQTGEVITGNQAPS
jgi:hypothetical protein